MVGMVRKFPLKQIYEKYVIIIIISIPYFMKEERFSFTSNWKQDEQAAGL